MKKTLICPAPAKRCRDAALFVLLFLALFAVLQADVMAYGPTQNPTAGLKGGDPIAVNSGSYYFSQPLLDLGGIIPLGTNLTYHMSSDHNSSGHGWFGFFFGYEYSASNDTYLKFQMSDTGNQAVFYDSGGGNFVISTTATKVYSLRQTGTDLSNGYFYLLDPVKGLLYVYEKRTTSKSRIRWIMDRNGNRITYEYGNGAYPYFATAVYENDGSEGNRKFTVAPTTVNGVPHIGTITERIWVGGIEQDGRSVIYGYNKCVSDDSFAYALCSVTDPGGNVTSFSHDWGLGLFPVTGVEKPLTNVPYSQAVSWLDNGISQWNRVTSQTDAYGNTTSFIYDASNPFDITTQETRPGGAVVTYHHFGEDQSPKSLTDASGKTANFTRPVTEPTNNVASVTDRMGDTTAFTYHAPTGRLASMTNAKGQTITYTYTSQNQTFTNPANSETVDFTFYNLTRTDYPDSTNEQFTYDAKGNMLTRVDRRAKTWTYTYNAKGQVLTITNPTGGVITRTYNSDGTLASSRDSATGTTTYGYDDYKRLTTITNPNATTTLIAYNLNNQITSITDGNNNTYSYTYDANGNLTKVTDPAGKETSYAYDLMDRVLQATDRNGKQTGFSYDSMSRLSTITDPNGLTATNTYNSRGWRTGVTRGGQTWTTGFDDEGVASSIMTPMTNTTAIQTDKLGHVSSISTPLGHTTTLTRDAMSRVTGITDPLSRTTNLGYDGGGLLTSVTLPTVGTATYARNNLGLFTGITDLKGSNWGFSYSAEGRLATSTDPLGNAWQHGYDTLGRLETTTFPDASTATRTYDAAGNVTRVLYSEGADIQTTYDTVNRFVSANNVALARDFEGRVTSTNDSGTAFGATYDNGGRLKTATYNNSLFTVTYTYNNTTGLLSNVTDGLTGASVDFTYDNDRKLTGINRSNGIDALFSYDASGRLTRLQDGSFIDLNYTLNSAGQITSVDATQPLDPAGLLADGTKTLTYDLASRTNSTGYVYDTLGRQTADPSVAFTWDGASRLTGIGTVTLTYNGLGNLRTRTESGTTTHYYYNKGLGLSPIVAERNDTAGQFTHYYVWTPGGQLLYMIDAADSNAVYFYHYDRAGSTLAMTSASGTVTDSYAYTPYGKLLGHTGTNQQPFTFTGKWGVRQEGGPSTSSGLYQARTRYYDAATARFISKEPIWPQIANPKTLNPYLYAFNNPVSFMDINGLNALVNDVWRLSENAWVQELAYIEEERERLGHRDKEWFDIANASNIYGTTTPASWIRQNESLTSDEQWFNNLIGSREIANKPERYNKPHDDDAFWNNLPDPEFNEKVQHTQAYYEKCKRVIPQAFKSMEQNYPLESLHLVMLQAAYSNLIRGNTCPPEILYAELYKYAKKYGWTDAEEATGNFLKGLIATQDYKDKHPEEFGQK